MVTKRLIYGTLLTCFILLVVIIIVVIIVPKSEQDLPVPGLKYKPSPRPGKRASSLIWVTSKPDSYDEFVKEIGVYLEKANKTAAKSNVSDCGSNVNNSTGCPFDIGTTANDECTADNEYGYKDGSPCLLIIMTNLIDWQPTDYPPGEVPQEIQSVYQPRHVVITCTGVSDLDKSGLGNITYHPLSGVSYVYFPLRGDIEDNVSPFVWVKFQMKKGHVVHVVCKAWAKNINHNADPSQGVIKLILLVE